ncbi:MAG TPA: hypothetical protein VNM16_06295 [Bacillota bacterium]|nr:hypothetical protein [Bacillota bacterium]
MPATDAPYAEWISLPVDGAPPRATALAAAGEGLLVAGAGRCALLRGDGAWEPLDAGWPLLRHGVAALLPSGPVLWAALAGGVGLRDGAGWHQVFDFVAAGLGGPLTLAADGLAPWVGLSGGGVGRLQPGGEFRLEAELPGPVRGLAALPAGVRLAATDAGLFRLAGRGQRPERLSDLPCRALAPQRGTLLVATADGLLAVGAGGDCARAPQDGGLPVRDLLQLAPAGEPGGPLPAQLWAGSAQGLLRHDGERWHDHQGPRWLPEDGVRALARTGTGLYAATAGGLVRLAPRPTTLAAKAAVLEGRLRQRHLRLGAYVAEAVLPAPGEGTGPRPVPSDNDGLWTGMYLAAEAYRFAATGQPDAAANAHAAFAALERLEAVTTIPGYPTKAIVEAAAGPPPDDGTPWYPSADGRWLWKGNCSSDEIVGHMYAYALYHDLVAGTEQRAQVAALVGRIIGHILEHDLQIIEFGQRTRWGYWNPEAVNGAEGLWGDRGLNSLEILSHLRVARHVLGDGPHREVHDRLVGMHGYARNTLRAKLDLVGHVNHSDDELAFLAYDPLLRYEDDPQLRAIYLEGLERLWALERPERNPLWNFIHAVHTGDPAGLAEAVQTLRELPADTVAWPVRNAQRADVTLDPIPDRHGRRQLTRVLPYDELAVVRWNGNPYQAEAGDPRVEGDGVHYLLPYWMGRQHGFIAPPAG